MSLNPARHRRKLRADRARAARPLLLLGLFGAVCAWSLSEGEAALPRVSDITVEGNHRASTISLRHLADVRAGDSLLTADLDQVVAGVNRHPWVESATVRRIFPDRLHVTVVEHDTALLLLQRGLYRVSADGEIFARARSADLDLPVLTGLDPDLADASPAAARGVLRQALRTVEVLEETAALPVEDISEVAFDPDLGFSLVLRNGSRLHLGYRDPAVQASRLIAMTGAGLDLTSPHEVDLDLDGLAVATPLSI